MARRNDRSTFVDFGGSGDGDEPGVPAEAPDVQRFRVDEELARGGLGRVHTGYDRSLDREVAIKALLKASPGARARFQRETLLTARLQHPNIVPVYDGGLDDDGEPFLAMRLVHGQSLADAIDALPSLEDRLDLLPHVIDVCNAVAYAHSQRIAHRDLKPDNILVGDFGEAVVIDWGLAKDLDAEDDLTAVDPEEQTLSGLSSHASLTRVGAVVGTPAYMPPEQAAGQLVEERADVYSLGAVLYHTLAGVRPYHDREDALQEVLLGPPTPMDEVVVGIPVDLVAVVRKAMARRPEDRYADAVELAKDLNRFRKGRFVSAYAYTVPELVVRFVKANRVAVSLATTLVVALGIGVAGLTWSHQVTEAARAEAVRAREQVDALREEERARLDALTLEQARLLERDEPAQALSLLEALSDDVVFDHHVRSIAAAAYARRPATQVRMPTPMKPLGLDVHGDRLLMFDRERLFRNDLSGWRTIPLPPGVNGIRFRTPDEIVLCAPPTTLRMDWSSDEVEDLHVPCSQLRGMAAGFYVIHTTQTTFWTDKGRKYLEHAPNTRVLTNDGEVWWSCDESGRMARTTPTGTDVRQRQSYGLRPSPDGEVVLNFYEAPALEVMPLNGPLVATPIEVEADWLSTGLWFDNRHALVGGAESAMFLFDRETSSIVETVQIDGAPLSVFNVGAGRIAARTDAGRVYLFEMLKGRLETHQITTSKDVQLVAAGEGGMLFSNEEGVYQQSFGARGEERIHDHGARVNALFMEPDGALLVGGHAGLERWTPDGATSLGSDLVRRLLSCNGRVWAGGRGWVAPVDDLGARESVRGMVMRMTCVDDRLVVGTGLGEVFTSGGDEPVRHQLGLPIVGLFAGDANEVMVLTTKGEHVLDQTTGALRVGPEHPEAIEQATKVNNDVVLVSGQNLYQDGVRLRSADSMPYAVAGGDALWIGGVDGGVTRWKNVEETPVRSRGHRQYVHVFAARPGRPMMASGGWDDQAFLWDTRGDALTGRPLIAHEAAVLSLVWSPDGKVLYTGDHRGEVYRWTDGLAWEPAALRKQVHAITTALTQGHPLPDQAELDALVGIPAP